MSTSSAAEIRASSSIDIADGCRTCKRRASVRIGIPLASASHSCVNRSSARTARMDRATRALSKPSAIWQHY